MNTLIIFAALAISIAAFGQDSEKPKGSNEFKRFLIGVNISPDYCNRILKNNNGSSTSSLIIDLRNKNEGAKFGYTAGANICYNFLKRLGIELGFQYSNKGYAYKSSGLTFGDPIDPRYGFVYTSSGSTTALSDVKFIYNHIYLDVPLRAILSFGEKRISFVASIGITANILLKATQTSVLEYENGDTKRETSDQHYDYKTLDISPTLSVGADYKISSKISLRVEPTIRYGLLKIIDAPITTYLWNSGLNITCYFALK